MKKDLLKIYAEFEKQGVLLLSDPELPSLVSVVTGEKVKGSWWGHPKGNLIYNLSQQFEDDPDILAVKMVNKKITYIHKKHWSALFTIVLEKSDWQTQGLKTETKKLLQAVQKNGLLRADEKFLKKTPTQIGQLASKLEEKLLIYSESLHTDSGKHVRILKSWNFLMQEKKISLNKMTITEAYKHFENIIASWSVANEKKVKVPWC